MEWQIGARDEARRDFDLAGNILVLMPQDGMTQLNRQSLTIARATAGDIEGAREHLCNCAARGLDDDEEDFIAAWAARALAHSGDFENATIQISSIKDLTIKDGLLSDLVEAVLRLEKFDEALALTRRISEPNPHISSLNAIAVWDAKRGRTTEASEILEISLSTAAEASAKMEGDTGPSSSYLYSEIAGAQADVGDFYAAFSTIEQFVGEKFKDSALMMLARAGAKAGNVEAVRKATNLVPNPSSRPEPDTLMVWAVAKAGNPQAALEMVGKTLDLASQAQSFLYVAQAYLDAGDQNAGLQMLDLASQRASGVTDKTQRSLIFCQIGLAQLGAGDKSKAARSLAEVDRRKVSFRMLPDLATMQVKAGDMDAALETARNAWNIQPAVVYQAIAEAQVRMRDPADALDWIAKLNSPFEEAMALIGAAQGTLNQAAGDADHN